MLFRALAFATFLASSAAADNDSFLRGDRLLGKPTDAGGGGNQGKGNTLSECATLGNGFPIGNADFKLNLLGKMKDIDYKPQGGNNIAIALSDKCKGKNGDNCSTSVNTKIILYNSDTNTEDCTEGVDFEVSDPNGLDGEAGLCLPDPFDSDEPCIDGAGATCTEEAKYAVYARVRGKGSLDMKLCATDSSGTDICPIGVVTVDQKRAKDISQELLTACIDADGDGDADGVGLFDKINGEEAEYFWDVDNEGVRNAELRFYSIQSLIDSCKGDGKCEECYDGVTRANACS